MSGREHEECHEERLVEGGWATGPALERLISMVQSVPSVVLHGMNVRFHASGAGVTVSLHEHDELLVESLLLVLRVPLRPREAARLESGTWCVQYGDADPERGGLRVLWFTDVESLERMIRVQLPEWAHAERSDPLNGTEVPFDTPVI